MLEHIDTVNRELVDEAIEQQDSSLIQKRHRISGEIEISSKVIESKTICYCSNFDIDFNEWLLAKENMTNFGKNLLANLGKKKC